jgi:hypothetical protein
MGVLMNKLIVSLEEICLVFSQRSFKSPKDVGNSLTMSLSPSTVICPLFSFAIS